MNLMNSVPIIEIKNIGKKYNINHQRGGYVTLRDTIMEVIHSPLVFLKAKMKRAAGLEVKEEFWALSGVSFNVQKGEIIGIIGGNGAGKSTLLKILSQITPPTTGEIIVRGKVGSLLEVGTGFHPELSGRENIFLNGAILGMTRREIAIKFNKIVEFAEIEKFIDTPVKYYSSGMYVRLAFSVAAHMEPDVLIIDEVLAVGDTAFQQKCLGKMGEITKKDGRTVLFVSHNMSAVEKLCKKCVVLKNGEVDFIGSTEESIQRYLDGFAGKKVFTEQQDDAKKYGPGRFSHFTDIETLNENNIPLSVFRMGDPVKVKFGFDLDSPISTLELGFAIVNITGERLSTFIGEWEGLPIQMDKGHHEIICRIENFRCFPGSYGITAWLKKKGEGVDQQIDATSQFSIIASDMTGYHPDFSVYPNMGVYQKSSWHITEG